jgi:acyl carrier protein
MDNFKKIRDTIVSMGFKESDVTEDMMISDGLGMDSTEVVELVFKIEKQYNVRLNKSDVLKSTVIELAQKLG